MIPPALFQSSIQAAAESLTGNDRAFFQRVWSTALDDYRRRLAAIGFTGLARVLDAGSGMGQWTYCLSERNDQVSAIDYSPTRVAVTQALFRQWGLTQVDVRQGTIEALPYADGWFDAVFCYGVIMATDYRKTVRELARVLKSGGRLYLSNNGLGWYLFNLIEPYQAASDYDPRQVAINALADSLTFFSEGRHVPGSTLVLPSALLRRALETVGFADIRVGADGTLQVADGDAMRSFFPAERYGVECYYEILARKT